MRHGESTLQQQCVLWFRRNYPEYALNYFAVPNGGGRSKIEAAIMHGEGCTAGVADTLLLVAAQGYYGLCVEYKTITYTWDPVKKKETAKKSYQSKEQKEWQAAVEKTGYKYVVVRTKDEFKEEIESYLGPRQ